MSADLIIRSNCIVTCSESGENTNEATDIIDGYISVTGGRIVEIGKGNVPEGCFKDKTEYIDAIGKTVIPGLIDSHTHLVHAGSRENELSVKLRGVPYLEILKMGGGILSTVAKTRAAGRDELKEKVKKSLDQMLIHGTTTVEAKSGYGLDLDTEVKCLEIAAELNREHPVDLVNTYMGAHAVPPEYKGNKEGYISLMLDKVLPYVARHELAEFVDIFCEEGVFSLQESRLLLNAAKQLGFKLKIHADEIVSLGGAGLAAEVKALSAEHLLAASEEGLIAMKEAGVTAVLLPGTSFCLMTGKYANALSMLEKGIRIALATDYNPGSCPTENLQTIMTFACYGMRLAPYEIIKAMTINAAYAVNRANDKGSLDIGKKADIVILNAPNLEYAIYHFGINHVEYVIKNGRIVVRDGNLVY